MSKHTESECRERWIFTLRPPTKNSWTSAEYLKLEQQTQKAWTSDEDESLKRLHAKHGNSWGKSLGRCQAVHTCNAVTVGRTC